MFTHTVAVNYEASGTGELVCIGQGSTLQKAALAAVHHYNGKQLAQHPENSTINADADCMQVLAEVFYGAEYTITITTKEG